MSANQGSVRARHFGTRAVGGVIFQEVWKFWMAK
jgi:hypothetical protein